MKEFLDAIDWKSFAYGVVATLIYGAVNFELRWVRKKVGAYFKPQSITLLTKQTPAQIGRGCSCGVLQFGILVVIVVVVVVVVLKSGLL